MISGFFGQHRFLSNFYPAEVTLSSVTYPTVEHAYQASKSIDAGERELIRLCSMPGLAKRMAKNLRHLRPDLLDVNVKLRIMEDLVRQKFKIKELRRQLLATGDKELEETNNWGDHFWGTSHGDGTNHLGHILMKIRSELRCP